MEITEKNYGSLKIGQTCWLQAGTHKPEQVRVEAIERHTQYTVVLVSGDTYSHEVTAPQITNYDNRLFTKKKDADKAYKGFMQGFLKGRY